MHHFAVSNVYFQALLLAVRRRVLKLRGGGQSSGKETLNGRQTMEIAAILNGQDKAIFRDL